MAPRNPSELARLEDELQFFKDAAKNPNRTKAAKEAALREVRRIEGILGFESVPYNSIDFGD